MLCVSTEGVCVPLTLLQELLWYKKLNFVDIFLHSCLNMYGGFISS
jgi:hypothetical protein